MTLDIPSALVGGAFVFFAIVICLAMAMLNHAFKRITELEAQMDELTDSTDGESWKTND